MSETNPDSKKIFISKAERAFVWEGIQKLFPELAAAKGQELVGKAEACESWRDMLDSVLVERIRHADAVVNGRERPIGRENRMSPIELVMRFNESKAKLVWFRGEIARLRAEAKAAYEARQARRVQQAAAK